MNQYLLHVNTDPARPRPHWQENLFSRGIVVMPVRSLSEAIKYCKVYQVLMVLLEIGENVEPLAQELGAVLSGAGEGVVLPPLLGLTVTATRPGAEALACLAQAGLADVLAADDPEPFILWRLDLLRRLGELHHFEKCRMDVGELAKRTRTHLHDMSQPLSAVQGRLQLMAAKCPPGDPNAQTFQDLVRLAFDITHQMMEMQQLHRQYS